MTSNFNKLSVSQIRNNVTDPFYFSDDLVIAYINPSSAPVRATQVDGFVALIMMQGTAYITLGSGTYELKPNMMMYIHNDSVLHKVECSSDAGAYLVAFSQQFISDVPVDISTSLPVYLRFGRLAVPVFHGEDMKFEIGKGVVIKEGTDVTIFATGLCVKEAMEAEALLAADGISAEI